MEIGARIRKIRTRTGLTIQEVADRCACSKGLLSKIETGKMLPAVATLTKIARALDVKVSVLMEDDESSSAAYTPNMLESPEAFTPTNKGYSIFAFAPHFINKKMQPILVLDRKGEVKDHIVAHEGEEFIFVLEGEVRIRLGNVDYHLKQGESIYFDSAYDHGVTPESTTAKYLDIFVE